MKSNANRTLILIFGILLVIMGAALFSSPIINTAFLGYLVCILMMVFGAVEIYFYFSMRNARAVSGWALADGILTMLLGLFLLFRPGAQILTMSIFFSAWVLLTGALRVASAFTLKKSGSDWGWALAAGILGIAMGIFLMMDPLFAIMTIGFLLPISFIIQGISAIALFLSSSKQ